MSIVSQIERIRKNIADAFAKAIEKGATSPSEQISDNLASCIESISTSSGGGSSITKGIIINAIDEDGYATDVSIIGMTELPGYYLHYSAHESSNRTGWMKGIGSNLHLPNNLTSIGQYCFGYCTNLTLTELPNSITTLNRNAFYECQNLALTKLPDNLETIGEYAFNNCTKLALTKFPEKLKTLSQNAFYGCTSLTSIELPASLTNLQSYAFRKCENLVEVISKGNLSRINASVFYDCTSLSKLVISNVTSVTILSNASAFTNTKIANGEGYIYVPDDLVESFKSASSWSTYANQIKGISELTEEA